MTDTRTIEVFGYFGKPKQITKQDFIARWSSHASELLNIGVNVMDITTTKAGEEFETLYANQNKQKATG